MSRIQSVEGTPRIRIVEPWWSRNIVFEQPGVHCFIRHSSSKIDARPLKDKFCECSHVVLEEIEHPPDLLEKALFCLLQPTRSCFLRLSSSVNSYSTLLCMVLCTPVFTRQRSGVTRSITLPLPYSKTPYWCSSIIHEKRPSTGSLILVLYVQELRMPCPV